MVTAETEIGAATWLGDREGIAFDQFNALNPIEKKQFLQLSAIRDACKAQYSIDRMNMSLADVNLIPTDILDTADDPLCRLVEFKADVKEAERVPHFARILNEWDKHLGAEDNILSDQAILLFAQTCGVKDVFISAAIIDGRQEILNEDKLENELTEAYIWDGVFLRKNLPDIGERLFDVMLKLDKRLDREQHRVYFKQLSEVCETVEDLYYKEKKFDQEHKLSKALLDLLEYAEKDGLSDDKRNAARNLCIALSSNLREMMHQPQMTDGALKDKVENLKTLSGKSEYKCLKTSRNFRQKLGNFLWCTIGFLAAMVKKTVTGSWCFRSNGGSKRHAVASELGGDAGMAFFKAMQQDHQHHSSADAAAAA